MAGIVAAARAVAVDVARGLLAVAHRIARLGLD